jgi:uncharacterized membrane protein
VTTQESVGLAEQEVAVRDGALALPAPAPPRLSLSFHLRLTRVTAAVLTVGAAAAYSAVSIYRFDHFAANGFDLGIQDQTVWGYSRLQIIPNTVLGVPNLLGDHFNPILMLLAPFRAVFDSADVLLVAQAVLLALAGVPIYLWGAQRLGPVAGLAFQASYLVFWGVLAGVVFDFHHVVFAVPAISTALYAAVNRRNRLLWAMVAVALLTREDVALTVAGLGLYLLLVQRRVRIGSVMMAGSVAWFVLLLDVVIPALGGSTYKHWTYTALGTGPISAFLFILQHPIKSVELLVTPLDKLRVGVGTFATWLFLPVLSPIALIAIPSFLERFWSSSPDLWSFHFQYSMLPAPILAFAAIDTAARLKGRLGGRWSDVATLALPLAAFAVSAVLTIAVVKPFAELSTYVSDAEAGQIQQCLSVIPANVSVAATDALVPHLTSRPEIYEVTQNSTADYIAIDLTTLGKVNPVDGQLRAIVSSSLANGYGVACSRGLTVVLARGVTSVQLTPEFQAWLSGT